MRYTLFTVFLLFAFTGSGLAQCEYPAAEPTALGNYNECNNVAPGFTGVPHDIGLPQPTCGTGPFSGDWYSFTTGASGSVIMRFENLTGNPVYASIFVVDGCFGQDDELFCSQLPLSLYSDIELIPFTTFLIFIYNDELTSPSSYTLCLQEDPCGKGVPGVNFATNLSHHGLTLNWDGGTLPAGGKYIIRYHEMGNSPNFMYKIVSNPSATTAYINGLDADTRYVFRVGSKCYDQTVATFSDTLSIRTKKTPCPKPTGAASIQNPGQTMTLSWDDMGVSGYKVRIFLNDWVYRNVSTNSVTVPVVPNEGYTWQVRSLCDPDRGSSYIDNQSFVYLEGSRLASTDTEVSELLYPNPATSSIRLNLTVDSEDLAVVNISDISGRVVETSTLPLTRGTNNPMLDISELHTGVYIVSINTTERSWKTQLVKN